jgi:signal transduction histidine kinase
VRGRLVSTYLVLIAIVLVLLEVPLAVTLASGRTQEMVIDRFVDAARFASLADPALGSGELISLADELDRYHQLYGISAAVVDRDAVVVASAGDRSLFRSASFDERARQALAGERVGSEGTIWPWRSAPLIVAVPVTSSDEVVGAVITLSPTGAVRADIAREWGLAGGGGLIAGAVIAAVAFGLARWILRPVSELDAAAHRIGTGRRLEAPLPAALGPPELRRLTRSFNDMAANVADLLGRQREFVALASHQMRNPLTALQLRVEALGEFIADPAGREEHRSALEETGRFGRILDELLALARAERGRHDRQVVDAAVTADERVAAWLPLATQRGISLSRTGVASAAVLALPTAVGQALDALIDNALKFAGPAATVRVDVRPAADFAANPAESESATDPADSAAIDIHVIDDGPGLNADGRRRAGERFWRAPGAQNLDGSGLGVPIATVLAETSGGRLDLVEASPRGLDARLRFPCAPPHEPSTPEAQLSPSTLSISV